MTHHTFPSTIKTVAIIGSGPGGTPAARHLSEAGLKVTVYERQARAGGIWNWRPETTKLAIPTNPPVTGAFTPVHDRRGQRVLYDPTREEREQFSPANPVYWTLSNNVPTTTMAFKDHPYPAGTPPNIRHDEIASYVHGYAKQFKIDEITRYSTRVEKVEKKDGQWELTLRSLHDVSTAADQAAEHIWTERFDAVLVATGHYTAPYIPAFPGLEEWAQKWPEQIIHSQGYRVPEPYKGKTVLVVGCGTSGVDIARDLVDSAAKIQIIGKSTITGPEQYKGLRKLQRRLVPDGAEVYGEIARFLPPSSSISTSSVELQDGRRLNVDAIIFATGYQYSYPFLPQYHHDSLSPSTLITTGENVHNLYRDVFYIPDPSLAFIGLSINTSAFSFFEYQSLAVARVFSGQARLPDLDRRNAAYAELVQQKGGGRHLHLLGRDLERVYVKETVEWINKDAKETGAVPIEGHSEEWLKASDSTLEMIIAKYGIDPRSLGDDPVVVPNVEVGPVHTQVAVAAA